MYQVMPVVGIVLTLTVPLVFFIFWKKVLPKAARTLFWCKRRNMPPLLIVHDSGRAELTMISEREGGAVMTRSGKFKLLPRFLSRRILKLSTETNPKAAPLVAVENGSDQSQVQGQNGKGEVINTSPINVDLSELDKLPDAKKELYNRFFPDYSAFISKRCQLMGLNLPLFLGYSGTACLVNPEALILYEAGEMAVQMNGVMNFNPNNIEGKTMAGVPQPLMLYDARVIKALIPETYDETQITAIATKSEMIGLLGRGFGRFIPMISIIIIVVLAIVGIFVVLPMIGG